MTASDSWHPWHCRADRRQAEGTGAAAGLRDRLQARCTGTGSGRSVTGFDLRAPGARRSWEAGILMKGGGHAHGRRHHAGEVTAVGELRAFFEQRATEAGQQPAGIGFAAIDAGGFRPMAPTLELCEMIGARGSPTARATASPSWPCRATRSPMWACRNRACQGQICARMPVGRAAGESPSAPPITISGASCSKTGAEAVHSGRFALDQPLERQPARSSSGSSMPRRRGCALFGGDRP